MNSEKNELFELCENIILNDNLNEESIREIAEHINNTPNALDCWPANILIDPLKKVWEDGKIDRSEINSLQNTLEKIVNETNQTEIQTDKFKEDEGVENLLDSNRSTADQIAALETQATTNRLLHIPVQEISRGHMFDTTVDVQHSLFDVLVPPVRDEAR